MLQGVEEPPAHGVVLAQREQLLELVDDEEHIAAALGHQRLHHPGQAPGVLGELGHEVVRSPGGDAQEGRGELLLGVGTLLLNGEKPGLLQSVLHGSQGGTLFLPQSRRLASRKHWIAFTLRSKGRLTLDDGAVQALVERGKSLLASGITGIAGDFQAGDAVSCVTRDGRECAKGLVNFSAEALSRIKGLKTADIRERYGQQEYEEVIHRDNLVLLE